MECWELEVRVGDGRRLLAEVSGPEDGALVVFHHGTPSTRRVFAGQLRDCAERGLRHVCYSRPAYEGSERVVGRSFADCAADVAAVADALGVEAFHNVGYSGGGPHALACAALLPDRVLSTTTFGSVAPHDAEGLDWMEGAGEENLEEFAAAEAGDEELQRFLRAGLAEMAEIETGEDVIAALGDLLSEADRDCLTGELLEHEVRSWRRTGEGDVWGWFDDDKALFSDWGFDLSQVTSPVTLWHGAEDRMVPVSNGAWLADRLPNAELRLVEGEGHISLLARYFGVALDDLQGEHLFGCVESS
jgi:pimeloyl-ACP methyl ester carboxylesterase